MKHHVGFRIAQAAAVGFAILAMTVTPMRAEQMEGPSNLYVQNTAAASTTSQSFTPVQGMSLTLPAASFSAKFALITLNMPNVYLTGGTTGATLGAAVAIAANSNIVAIGSMTGDVVVGTGGAVNDGRKPVTVVVKIPLGTSTMTVSALWAGTRNTTVNTDTFASLSALLLSN